jgi:hypothetical protein
VHEHILIMIIKYYMVRVRMAAVLVSAFRMHCISEVLTRFVFIIIN